MWRSADEKFKPFATRGTLKHDAKNMVWSCFSARGRGYTLNSMNQKINKLSFFQMVVVFSSWTTILSTKSIKAYFENPKERFPWCGRVIRLI